ncbi:MAG: helix-turn-helix domain-containing protein [Sphingobium sp.]|nr:helix-turn-helix domain-containing protein [Sphingobium sp.]
MRYWEPPYHLRYYFGAIYYFRVQASHYRDGTRADMPQLRFMLSTEGEYHFWDGRSAVTPRICILGPTMGATSFTAHAADGVLRLFGVSVLPLGWQALGCEDAAGWVDRLYDAAEVHGPQYEDMFKRLRHLTEEDVEEGVNHLWAFLEQQLSPVPPMMFELVNAIDHWLGDKPAPRIEDLLTATGLSARQVTRYTNRLYGAPPKLLARKYRALRCASQIVLDKKSWIELCDEGSFYDQSHFIREIKQFLGHTPSQLLSDPSAVGRLTLQRRALTGITKLNRIS